MNIIFPKTFLENNIFDDILPTFYRVKIQTAELKEPKESQEKKKHSSDNAIHVFVRSIISRSNISGQTL